MEFDKVFCLFYFCFWPDFDSTNTIWMQWNTKRSWGMESGIEQVQVRLNFMQLVQPQMPRCKLKNTLALQLSRMRSTRRMWKFIVFRVLCELLSKYGQHPVNARKLKAVVQWKNTWEKEHRKKEAVNAYLNSNFWGPSCSHNESELSNSMKFNFVQKQATRKQLPVIFGLNEVKVKGGTMEYSSI